MARKIDDLDSDRPSEHKSNKDCYVEGKFLVSTPAMEDPRFHQSVVYILEHDFNGAMGLMINKPLDGMNFKELLDQLSIDNCKKCPDIEIYYGGPVDIGRGFVIHSKDVMVEHTVDIGPFAVSTSTEMLEVIAKDQGPDQLIFTLGYAGWEAGQLDDELRSDAWLCLDCCHQTVFDAEPQNRWKVALENAGIDSKRLHDCSGSA